jgi:endo-1,4-beta-xylanase
VESGVPSGGLTAGAVRYAVLGSLWMFACASEPVGGNEEPARVPLRQLAAARGLAIGSAVDRGFQLAGDEGAQFRATLASEFNVLTPENDMKHERLQPSRGVYDFAPADSLVVFAQANEMQVRGHTLVWDRQLAPWLTDGTWTKAEAEALLQDHIVNVVGHYGGQVVAWDVINEAFASDGALRSGFWLDHIGPEYIELAFQWARATDPEAELFYNDYSLEWPGPKSDSAYALLSDLVGRGVPVDGIGFQAHLEVGQVPAQAELAAGFERFASLGLAVHITELDVRLPLPATAENLQQQAQDYAAVVGACLQTPACDMVVMWGFTDADSWIPAAFPGFGQALIFDAAYQPKPAYWAVHSLLR